MAANSGMVDEAIWIVSNFNPDPDLWGISKQSSTSQVNSKMQTLHSDPSQSNEIHREEPIRIDLQQQENLHDSAVVSLDSKKQKCKSDKSENNTQSETSRKNKGNLNQLQRLRQMEDCRRKQHPDRRRGDFLTIVHSDSSCLPRLRGATRKAMYHWFCSGDGSYSSPLVHRIMPLDVDHKLRVVSMLGDMSEVLSYSEAQWFDEPKKMSHEEMVGHGWMAQ